MVDTMSADPQIDYRDLLKRYMQHVGDCEGTTFLDHIADTEQARRAKAEGRIPQFGAVIEAHEREELRRLDDEITQEMRRVSSEREDEMTESADMVKEAEERLQRARAQYAGMNHAGYVEAFRSVTAGLALAEENAVWAAGDPPPPAEGVRRQAERMLYDPDLSPLPPAAMVEAFRQARERLTNDLRRARRLSRGVSRHPEAQ